MAAVNGQNIPSTYRGTPAGSELIATIPAGVALPGNLNHVTVTTPAPGGGTSSALVYNGYISIQSNDLVYNAADGLLYASLPGAAGRMGNSIIAIDPVTGNVTRTIWVGSNPNKLALSSDDTQLFVGLDGAAAVAQVNLATGKVVNQFSLWDGQSIWSAPPTSLYMAAVPGSPNSVAVALSGGIGDYPGIAIFDSGVERAQTFTHYAPGPLTFGSTASTLYMASSSGVIKLTVGSTGITAGSVLSSLVAGDIQFDNGNLYLSNGDVVNAANGALLGTFHSTSTALGFGTTPAFGSVVSDSTIGLAFVAFDMYSPSVLAFNESTFNSAGSIPIDGAAVYSLDKIVRWGQNGVALRTSGQIFILQSPVVKDLSPAPADLSVTLSAPQSAATGSAFSYVATVKNLGTNSAQGATLSLKLDSSLIVNSITAAHGSCGAGNSVACDLGTIADGASTTVTVSVTPTTSEAVAGYAFVTAVSYDPVVANNQSNTSTTISGSFYSMLPVVTTVSPAMVQAGSGDFTLTVNGNGFNAASTVNVGGVAMSTTYVSATQITADVPASSIANYGWAPITVINSTPGGGTSAVLPLTIYALVDVPANAILFDPFSQNLYATVPATATGLTGNSIMAINPATASVGTPVAIGSDPGPMAETSDGNYLFVGLTGSDSLAKFDLIHQTVAATIPLTYTQSGASSNVKATYLAAMPGTDSTLAVELLGNSSFNFGLLDINGSTGTFRPDLSGDYNGDDPVFASRTELYAYDGETTTEPKFYRYSVDANGVTLMDGTILNGMGGSQTGFVLADGLVYGGAGGIVNPSTTPPSQVAKLPPVASLQSVLAPSTAGSLPDPSTQREFLMEGINGTSVYTSMFALTRFNLNTYMPESYLVMPQFASSLAANWTMLRFGPDGIALLYNNSDGIGDGIGSPLVQLMLLKGPFVTPQELSVSTAASLSSSSASSITHGSGNTMLTLTGTNFLPGVAVTWNGNYRTTTVVDSTHVTVAIPVSDLVNAGSASVVATNPGAAASNTLTITIN